MHRRLADIVDEPELRARHLALAATSGDQVTLQALDTAAESARSRGAPAAAAELMELAIGLGGDTADRRLRSALHHFDAGDQERARAVLEETIDRLEPGDQRAEALIRLAVVRVYGDGFFEAARLLQRALSEVRPDSPLRVQILITLAYSLLNNNQPRASMQMAEEAVAQADRLNQPHLLGLALGMRTVLRFLCGEGFDEAGIIAPWSWRTRTSSRPWYFGHPLSGPCCWSGPAASTKPMSYLKLSGAVSGRRVRKASSYSSPSTWC